MKLNPSQLVAHRISGLDKKMGVRVQQGEIGMLMLNRAIH